MKFGQYADRIKMGKLTSAMASVEVAEQALETILRRMEADGVTWDDISKDDCATLVELSTAVSVARSMVVKRVQVSNATK